jgi:two-component system NarL family response regulator
MNSPQLRLLLADDHALVRIGLKTSLEMEQDFAIVADVATGEEAIAQFRVHRPDVALIDLRLPGIDGVQTTAALCAEFPDAKVIMLSTFHSGDEILRAMRAGAKSYLTKSVQREELVNAIRTVAAGETYVPGVVANRLAQRLRQPDLTEREMEVLRLIAAGNSNKEIAAALALEATTVKQHVGKILEKLRARDRTEAVIIAIQHGIIRLD